MPGKGDGCDAMRCKPAGWLLLASEPQSQARSTCWRSPLQPVPNTAHGDDTSARRAAGGAVLCCAVFQRKAAPPPTHTPVLSASGPSCVCRNGCCAMNSPLRYGRILINPQDPPWNRTTFPALASLCASRLCARASAS